MLWVVAAAATGDRVAGLLAAVSGGVWFDFFLTEPYQRFTIADPDDVEATVLLVVIGLAVTRDRTVGAPAAGARRAHAPGYLDGVLATAKVVSEGDTPASVLVEVVARQIADVLGADDCTFVGGPVQDRRIAVLDHDGVVTRDGHPWPWSGWGCPRTSTSPSRSARGRRSSGTSWSSPPRT